jgi:glutathione S-transferase
MYTLHYAPDNASLIIRLVLEEAGLPYRTALVDRGHKAQDSAAYRAINPAGLIPALETPDGPIFETAAILLWLSDRHDLGPAPDAPTRGAFLKWLFFISNTAHGDLRQLFYPGQYVPMDATAGHHALLSTRMQRHFTLLDRAAEANPDLFAPASVLACYLAPLMRWSVLYPMGQTKWFHLTDYPQLHALAAALETRPAALRAAVIEGLGPTPFTAPGYASPTEGSAL